MVFHRRFLTVAALAAALALSAPVAARAAVIPCDLADLVARADAVVAVHVTGSESRGTGASDNQRRTIVTDTKLHVTKVLKGDKPASITITQPGGVAGAERLVVTELPEFTVGERCILFLNANGGVVCGYQGKLAIVDGQVPALEMSVNDAEKTIRRLIRMPDPEEPPAPPALPVELSPHVPFGSAPLASVPNLQTAGGEPTVDVAPAVTVFDAGFEGGSTSGWSLYGSPTWAATAYRARTGSYSLYGSGGGTGAVAAPGPCPAPVYADAVRSFSTLGYSTATLEFDVYSVLSSASSNWMNVAFATSTSGPWSYETSTFVQGDTGGWQHVRVDLRGVHDYFNGGVVDFTGLPTVYMRMTFSHGAGTADEGVYVDNVLLTGDSVELPTVASIAPQGANAGIGSTVTINGTDFGATQGSGKVQFLHGSYLNGTRVDAPVTSWSDTQIVCTVPRRAASGGVVVTNSEGLTTAGYDYQVGFSTGGLHVTALPFTYRINENTGDLAGEGAAIEDAFLSWNSAGSNFNLGYGGTCTSTANPPSARDYHNDIYFSNTGFTDSGILAWNQYWFSGTSIVESDIIFNDSHAWADGAVAGKFDVVTVALHELGHTVGLDDQFPDTAKIMGAGSPNLARRTLTQAEIDGAIHLYGAADTTPPSAPEIASSTHPLSGTWYSDAAPSLSFVATDTGDVVGYSYVLDQSADTVPDAVSEGAETSKSYSGLDDGRHWFHVRAVDSAGNWGPITHRQVLVDTEAPALAADAASEYVGSATVSASATDTLSGVAAFAHSVDAGPFEDGPSANVTELGAHTIVFRATDGAGNSRETGCSFTIVAQALAWRVEQDDAHIAYRGPWSTAPSAARSAGSWAYVNASGAMAAVRFSGTSLDLIGSVAPTYGKARVTVDGGTPTLVDYYSAGYVHQATIFSAQGLASGEHTVTIEWTGTKNPASTGTGIGLDAVETDGGLLQAETPTVPIVRTEQTDPRIAFEGEWVTSANEARSSGSWLYSNAAGAAATVRFKGTGLTLVGSKAPTYGVARVSVDGQAPVLVDYYSATHRHQVSLLELDALADATHVVRIEWTGTKNAAASGTGIGLDAVDVAGSLEQAVLRFEETDSRLVFDGPWTVSASSARSAGAWSYVNAAGAMATVEFNGTGFDLIGSKAPTYGIARVTLDGGAPSLVDFYSPTYLHKWRLHSVRDLPPGDHTATIEWTGSRHASSTGTGIGFDAIDVLGGLKQAVSPLTRYEEDSSLIDFEGTWSLAASSARSGGAWAYTNTSGAAASFTFTGTRFDLIGSTAPTYGRARVIVDGGAPVYADFYSSGYVHRTKVLSRAGLAPGEHTVRIEWTGERNAFSTNTGIGVDAVDVLGPTD